MTLSMLSIDTKEKNELDLPATNAEGISSAVSLGSLKIAM